MNMRQIIFSCLVLFGTVGSVFAQYDCKVLVKELQGQYNGECKKGLANGEGRAKGEDEYAGSFKKGYPNGFGIYTYANGSVYIGNYNKGLKDGYGYLKKINESGAVQKDYGLWLADSLIIDNDVKALYKVKERKGVKVIDPKLTKDEGLENQVWIQFMVDGFPDKSVELTKAEISSGTQISTRDRSLNTLVAFGEIKEFPVTFRLEYQIRQINHFEMKDCILEIMLFTDGIWEINVNH